MKLSKYKYKFLLNEDLVITLPYAVVDVEHAFFTIKDNVLTIKKGYAWDGCTGAIDTKGTLTAGLVHDVLYQAMRESLIDLSYRKYADLTFYSFLQKYATNKFKAFRSNYMFWVVRLIGERYARPELVRKSDEISEKVKVETTKYI